MIKNGRPITTNAATGKKDDKLIASRSPKEIIIISNWIRTNISPEETSDARVTSGMLAEMICAETGVDVTENEVKDVMLLAGYLPEKPEKEEWCYRLALTRHYNPNAFVMWLRGFMLEDGNEGSFARAVIRDPWFPVMADREIVKNYLSFAKADPEVIAFVDDMWDQFVEEQEDALPIFILNQEDTPTSTGGGRNR